MTRGTEIFLGLTVSSYMGFDLVKNKIIDGEQTTIPSLSLEITFLLMGLYLAAYNLLKIHRERVDDDEAANGDGFY